MTCWMLRYISCLCYRTKTGVQLPAATKSQTYEAGIDIKRKEVCSGDAQPGRTVDSCPKDHLNPPAQAHSSYR